MADTVDRRLARGLLRPAVLCCVLFGGALPGYGQVSVFAASELRAAGLKDRLRGIQTALKDGAAAARRHSAAISDAFKETSDWAPATEAYYARKSDLIAHAAALEIKLDAVIARNSPETAEDAALALEEVFKQSDVLNADYEFYMKLPRLAAGPQRQAAQAAMRLLAQTGDFPVTLAYFLNKTPNRPPFAPFPPGMMPIRHR